MYCARSCALLKNFLAIIAQLTVLTNFKQAMILLRLVSICVYHLLWCRNSFFGICSLILAQIRKPKYSPNPGSKSQHLWPILSLLSEVAAVCWRMAISKLATLLPRTFLQMCSHKKKSTQIHMSVAFIASFSSSSLTTTAYVLNVQTASIQQYSTHNKTTLFLTSHMHGFVSFST